MYRTSTDNYDDGDSDGEKVVGSGLLSVANDQFTLLHSVPKSKSYILYPLCV